MRVKLLQLDLELPKNLALEELRCWIFYHLCKYGEPLRWAITFVNQPASDNLLRQLHVEAVVVIL